MNHNVVDWHPTAPIENLKKRANLLRKIREFFYARDVWEVETPLLASCGITDLYIENFETSYGKLNQTLYLQTSPEYAMKRLIAADSGSIYYLGKAFRQGEAGRFHNPEFTMLEWYRMGFDEFALMEEVAALLTEILQCPKAEFYSYHNIFKEYLNINPHLASAERLKQIAIEKELVDADSSNFKSVNDWLDLLFSLIIQPTLGHSSPVLIHDYPASQAMLAKIQPSQEGFPIARRFECFYKGMELGNGFYELQDANEQRQRFVNDNLARRQQGFTEKPIDERFLNALHHGLPNCAGIALGIDRIMMLALGAKSIAEVVSFSVDVA